MTYWYRESILKYNQIMISFENRESIDQVYSVPSFSNIKWYNIRCWVETEPHFEKQHTRVWANWSWHKLWTSPSASQVWPTSGIHVGFLPNLPSKTSRNCHLRWKKTRIDKNSLNGKTVPTWNCQWTFWSWLLIFKFHLPSVSLASLL